MIRLKDIAARAGVSVMTVSKVLRDAPDISEATKARIKLIARQMGYVPDSSAQGLRTKTTKLFGLIIPSSTNPIYARMVVAVEERAHELGYAKSIGVSNFSVAELAQVIESGSIAPAANQVQFSPFEFRRGLLEHGLDVHEACHRHLAIRLA